MAIDTPTVFETERLTAHHWRLSDAEDAYSMYKDPEVTRYIGGVHEESVATMTERLHKLIARNQFFDDRMGSFPMYCKTRRQLVGSAIINPLPDNDGEYTQDIQIGWHLHRDEWKKGYATEFGKALVDYGFDQLKAPILHIVVEPPNAPSMRVADRLGAEHQGRVNKYYSLELEHYLIRGR